MRGLVDSDEVDLVVKSRAKSRGFRDEKPGSSFGAVIAS